MLADIDSSGRIDATDIDLLSAAIQADSSEPQFDLNLDGQVDLKDKSFLIQDVLRTNFGDANLDGRFNSTDLVLIFQRGAYEDDLAFNSGWADGDWNGDGEFDSTDLVWAFRSGAYTTNIAAAIDAVFVDHRRGR